MNFLADYGTTEGPLGLPCTEQQAFALDTLLKALPAADRVVTKAALPSALTTLEIGERADVSWISTESIDRYGEIVLAKGLDDSHFKLNPLVPLGHNYWAPPVGKALWWKAEETGKRKGIVAKTHYPPMPESWTPGKAWQPDECFALIQSGLLAAKSIGFIALKKRDSTDDERAANPNLRLVVEKWLMLEYSVCPIGVNQEATVAAVSKALNLELSPVTRKALGIDQPPPERPDLERIPFRTLAETVAAIHRHLDALDPAAIAKQLAQETLEKRQGRV